jgi:hypothetical protein
MTLSEEARNYAVLVAQRRDAEATVKKLTTEQAKMERSLLERMGDEGIASLKVETDTGRFTISPRRELRASCIPGHEADLDSGFRAIGYDDMVKESVNANRLSAYVREIDAAGGEIPPEIAGAIQIVELFKLGVTRSSRS